MLEWRRGERASHRGADTDVRGRDEDVVDECAHCARCVVVVVAPHAAFLRPWAALRSARFTNAGVADSMPRVRRG